MTVPRASTWSTTLWYATVQLPLAPRLMFSTRAGLGLSGTPGTEMPAAHNMPAWMSASVPKHLPSTRTGSTDTPGAAPAMPRPLLVAAPTRLAVRVPCQLLLEALQPLKVPRPASALLTQSPGSLASSSRPGWLSLATVLLLTKS